MDQYVEKIKTAFTDYEEDELLEYVGQALDAGADPIGLITLLSEIMEGIGEGFSRGELFLPDMVMAGGQMEACIEVIKPAIGANNGEVPKGAKVVLGTVAGDIHDIGKNMVKTMLVASGFDVVDLGIDVSAEKFYNAVLAEKPAVLVLSSCMTITIPSMVDTIELIKSKGLLDNLQIVVGGGSMNPGLADSFGSCTYGGHDAFEAAKVLKRITA